jgi:hypothetical protein
VRRRLSASARGAGDRAACRLCVMVTCCDLVAQPIMNRHPSIGPIGPTRVVMIPKRSHLALVSIKVGAIHLDEMPRLRRCHPAGRHWEGSSANDRR